MLQIGDTVSIKNTNLIGTIARIDKQNCVVNILPSNNSLTVTQALLELITLPANYKTTPRVNITYTTSREVFDNEIMLRHQTVEVALENLEQFISQAICHKEKRLRIIHGKHGGVLRNAVHEYLKESPFIERYELAGYHEGSFGVTIAYLK